MSAHTLLISSHDAPDKSVLLVTLTCRSFKSHSPRSGPYGRFGALQGDAEIQSKRLRYASQTRLNVACVPLYGSSAYGEKAGLPQTECDSLLRAVIWQGMRLCPMTVSDFRFSWSPRVCWSGRPMFVFVRRLMKKLRPGPIARIDLREDGKQQASHFERDKAPRVVLSDSEWTIRGPLPARRSQRRHVRLPRTLGKDYHHFCSVGRPGGQTGSKYLPTVAVCMEPTKRRALLCSHCGLITRSKCAGRAALTCHLPKLLMHAQFAELAR